MRAKSVKNLQTVSDLTKIVAILWILSPNLEKMSVNFNYCHKFVTFCRAWEEKPADIARLDFWSFIGFLRAESLGEGVVKDMALEIADG